MAISSEVEKLERRWSENPSGLTFAPLAEAYRKAGDQQRALEILEIGLAVHPDYVPALIVQGRCHLDTANLADAEAAFQQVLARDPVNAIALKGMADLCERGGRVAEAIERLELLLEVDRSNGEAVADLARLKSAPPGAAPVASDASPVETAMESVVVPADEPAAEQAAGEDSFTIENLSVDPMARDDEPESTPVEARLSWEPVEMPGWDQPKPESAEPVAVESPAPEQPAGEQDLAGASSAPLEGLMLVSEAPEAPAEAVAEPSLAPAWEWLLAAGAARPAEGSVGAESGSDQEDTVSEPTESADTGLMAPVEVAETVSVADDRVEDEVPAAEAEVSAEDAEPVAEAEMDDLTGGLPAVDVPPAEPVAVHPGSVGPSEPDWGEVASEAMPSESHIMNQPVPPESPEAADVPWPEVASTAEEVVEPSVAESVASEPVEGESAGEPPAAEQSDEPALIVTESMAELFLKQGHRELSLAVYRQLLERSPASESLLDAISRLEREATARENAEAAPARPSRAASVTGGEPVAAMLQAVLSSPPPASASTVLPPAIEPVVTGEPARAGTEPLTLGQVFGDEPSMPPPAMETEPEQGGEPSFDEFFGASSGSSDTTAPAGGPRGPEGEDMRQFNDWLKGLKR